MRFGITLVLFLVLSQSIAQFKNFQIGDAAAVSSMGGPSIAINKKNPNNIVAASASEIMYYTFDGGTSWQSSALSPVSGILGGAVLVSDDKGMIYSFHLSGSQKEGTANEKNFDQILCHVSKDGGKTWEEGSAVGLNAPKDQVGPWATVDTKGNVWVAWTQYDRYNDQDENCQSFILLSNSPNGKKWSKPLQVSQTPGNCKGDDDSAAGAVPAIGTDGKTFLAWSNQNKIFLDRSFANGLWLTNDIAVRQQPGGWKQKISGHVNASGTPILMIDQSKSVYQNSLYLVWADQKNDDDTDVWFIRSTNYGDNWSTPLKLTSSDKGHQYMPWMTVDQVTGYIYVIFYDRSAYDDKQTDVYLAYSTDGGVSFKNVKVSESPFIPDENVPFSTYSNIIAHNGIIMPIWTRMDNGKPGLWSAIIKQSDIIKIPQASGKKKKKS